MNEEAKAIGERLEDITARVTEMLQPFCAELGADIIVIMAKPVTQPDGEVDGLGVLALGATVPEPIVTRLLRQWLASRQQ